MNHEEQTRLFESWMQEHAAIPQKVARSFGAVKADQQDLLQEIRLAVWLAIPAYDGRSKVSSYLYRVSLNRAISWRRRPQNRKGQTDVIEDPERIADQAAESDPRLAIVYEAIRQLPEAERALILLQLDGFSYREIAHTLGLTESNVGVRLNRIRTKLAEQLKGKNP